MSELPETRIALLENNQRIMSQEISEIKEIVTKFDEKLDKALEKKANVWVETAFTWLLYTIAGFIVGAFMYLILKSKI